jgi:hypothetical protein
MIQNYRLAHFDQLMKPNSHQLEARTDFVQQMGKSVKSSQKYSSLPPTALYSNRTETELTDMENIQTRFRNSIAKLLQQCSLESTGSIGDKDHQHIHSSTLISMKSDTKVSLEDPIADESSNAERPIDERLQPAEIEAIYLHTEG